MQFEKQATGIAKRMTFRIPTPQGSGLGETIGTGGRNPVVFAGFGSTRTAWTGRSYATETRLRGGTRRRLRPNVHSRLLTKMDSVGSGARPWNLLPSGIVTSVANVTDRGGRPMCPIHVTTLRPVLWRCHRLCAPYCHLLFGRPPWISRRHCVELPT